MKPVVRAMIASAFVAAVAIHAQDAAWETVSIPGVCTYQIPPTVEIQKGTYKKLNDQFRKTVLRIEKSADRVVAQPKGINDFDAAALKRYCRIIVKTERGKEGDYPKLAMPQGVTAEDTAVGMVDLDKELRGQFQQDAASSTANGMRMDVLSWQPVQIVPVDGLTALLITYSRSINGGPPALVRMYRIPNGDTKYEITLSYRESEKDLWADDLGKVIATVRFEPHGQVVTPTAQDTAIQFLRWFYVRESTQGAQEPTVFLDVGSIQKGVARILGRDSLSDHQAEVFAGLLAEYLRWRGGRVDRVEVESVSEQQGAPDATTVLISVKITGTTTGAPMDARQQLAIEAAMKSPAAIQALRSQTTQLASLSDEEVRAYFHSLVELKSGQAFSNTVSHRLLIGRTATGHLIQDWTRASASSVGLVQEIADMLALQSKPR